MVDPATGGGCCHHFCNVVLRVVGRAQRIVPDVPRARLRPFARHRVCVLSAAAPRDAGNAAAAAAEVEDELLEGQTLISVPSGGAMGLTVSNTAEGRGVRVHALVKGNCADRAGLRKGDIVLQVCGIKVHATRSRSS